MFVVDTNILIYAANRNCLEHKCCREFLERWRVQNSVWYTTWGIIYEFLRVTTHPRVFQHPWSIEKAWAFVQALLDAPNLTVLSETDRHHKTAKEIFALNQLVTGNLVFDAHTAILMKEHGVQVIYTHDMDFHRFPFLKVVDPLTA